MRKALFDGVVVPLRPRYSTRKSFYGHATVKLQDPDGESVNDLFSYNSWIASIAWRGMTEVRVETNPDLGDLVPYSLTTGRHLKEWLLQAGVDVPRLLKDFKATSLKDLFLHRLKGTVFYAPLRE